MQSKSLTMSLAMSLAMLVLVLSVRAETHTIHFDNQCGFGTPTLVSNGVVLSTGGDVTVNGPIEAVAYLQTGACGLDGENCTTVDISLTNAIPGEPGGSASSAAIDIVPPHAFSAVTGFGYYNGCDGAGEDCTNANCIAALPGLPPKTIVPVLCQTDNVRVGGSMRSVCAGRRMQSSDLLISRR
ncbi:glycopeptide [Ganoderma leucocontextum]|nr:glycopeptide [Ganoderma leucocontextum]